MIISNPQWQGSGGYHLVEGNTILKEYFKTDVPTVLLNGESTKEQGINHLTSIKAQADNFWQLLELHQPPRLLTLGGDCGIEPVPVAYLNSIYKQLGIIWFDAHADLNLPHTSPSGNFHGMPLGVLLEGDESWPYSGSIEYSQIHYLGLRDIDPYEQEVIEKHDITRQRKLDTGLLLEELKIYNNLYIHFDVDVLDPTEFPHSFYQVSEGWTVESCMEALNQLQANFNIVGGSITEVTASSLTQLEPITPILDWFRDQFINE